MGGLFIEMIRIVGLIKCGNPDIASNLTKIFRIPLTPFPGLKIIFSDDIELTVENVNLDTTRLLTLNGEIIVKFKSEVYDGSEFIVEELMRQGWYDMDINERKLKDKLNKR